MDDPDATAPGGAAGLPAGQATNGQSAAPGNPFSSAPFSNVFSDIRAHSESPAPGEPPQRPFVPNPLPTHRGTFEALFAGQGMGAAPAAPGGGRVGRYTLREILPFLPPSLVTQSQLNLDRSVEVPLPADGSGEVKLSAIQRVCPEIFASEINPLNDSEITLPKVGSGAPLAQTPEIFRQPGGASVPLPPLDRGRPLESHPVTLGAGRPDIFAPIEAGSSAPATAVAVAMASNPFAAPIAVGAPASVARMESRPIGNPFSASASELATQTPVAAAVSASGFGFPERKEPVSPFGAFGTPPVPANVPAPPPTSGVGPIIDPWSGGAAAAPSGLGFDLGFGDSEPFSAPKNVSLTPQSAPDPRPKPAVEPISLGLPWAVKPESTDAVASPFVGPKTASPFGPNPFEGPPAAKTADNPFAPPSESSEVAETPVRKPAASWPFGEGWVPLVDADQAPAVAKPIAPEPERARAEVAVPSLPPAVSGATGEEKEFRSLFGLGSSGQSAGIAPPASFFDQPHPPAGSPAAPKASSFDFPPPRGPLETPKKPEPPAAVPSESQNCESVVFTLAEILRPVAQQAGLDLAAIPPQAKVRLPVSLIESQLATGSVSVTIRDLVRHAAEGTAALERVDPGFLVTLPENELFHQISDFAPDLVFGSDEELDAQFSTLFGAEARADDGIGWENEILEDDPEPVSAGRPRVGNAPAPEPEPAGSAMPVAEEPRGLVIEGTLSHAEALVSLPKRIAPLVSPPVSVKPGKKPVDIAATVTPPVPSSQPTPKAPSLSDPFAPLPRRTQAEPVAPKKKEPTLPVEPPIAKAAEVLEEFETSFFDDLGLFSTPHAASGADLGDDAEGDDWGDDSLGAFPTNDSAHWGFSGFSTLEDLEPALPPAKPVAANPVSAKSPKISVSVQKNTPAPVARKPVATGFFDELESADPKPAAVASAASPVVPTRVAPIAVATPEPSPAPSPPATPPARPQTPPAPAHQEIATGLPRDIELRAVFGTNEPFTFLRVADLTAALPGITACSIIAPGCTAQAPRGRDAGDLAAQAGALLNGVRGIAQATGMTNAETFTLYTDQGLISVFLHGEHCLTVRHQVGQFDPGVREKLILVARGLAGLAG